MGDQIMNYIDDNTLDRWIKEDLPYGDLTTHLLNLSAKDGKISFTTREETVVCGTEEVSRIFSKFNIETKYIISTGTVLNPGEKIIEGYGNADSLHAIWRVSLIILEYASGIAERTRKMLNIIRAQNSNANLVSTRKSFPGTKDLSVKAVIAGGGLPHRLGLSETILIFNQHRRFLGEKLVNYISNIKSHIREKKIIVEVNGIEDALSLCSAGVDGVQFDKVSPEELKKYVKSLRTINPSLLIIASGGIDCENVAQYALTGVNTISSSSMYFGKPANINAVLEPL
jgi:molybdenum transport protein